MAYCHFFIMQKKKVINKAQKLLDSGLNCNEVAKQLKIKPATIRKAIQQGKLHRPNLNKATAGINEKGLKPTTKSERNLEDSKASLGLGCTNEPARIMAAKGQLKAVEPIFTKSSDVQSAGVLIALPALLANGLLKFTGKYFRLPNGYYGMETIFVILAFAALLRIKSIEGVRYCDPCEFGKIVGIDRIPEVKTLREKIEILANNGKSKEWSRDLAVLWMEETA
ncbi:homeodomain-like insertion element (DNA transposition) [Candidatus Magnetomorum sp. HK-1]|nr:homeodomain-like insertion element (DNA transposition) [Candidatus Magnetomorum sp. HK-1]